MIKIRTSRFALLAAGFAIATSALIQPAPAQAADKSKTYKYGAIALGALGAYFLSKGKTVEGAAALGGGYLAYKKGQKESDNDRYGRYDNRDRDRNNRDKNWDSSYNNSNQNNSGYNNGYNSNYNSGYNSNYNSGYRNGGYNGTDYSYNDGRNDENCRPDDRSDYRNNNNRRGNTSYARR